MADRIRFRPFTGDSERKIKMRNPPLALVLVQIRWPEHARFTRDFQKLALDFGESLDEFPLYNEVTESGIQITPEGVTSIPGETAYQWHSTDDIWTVHLTKRFISLYCTRHEDYEFAELQRHLELITEHVQKVLKVQTIERIGIRYINRITDEALMSSLSQIFVPAVLGYAQLDGFQSDVKLMSSVNQSVFAADDVKLHVRSGKLQPGETPDPAVVAVDGNSWVLDLDASIEQRSVFDPTDVTRATGRLADVVYDFFKCVLLDGSENFLDGAK